MYAREHGVPHFHARYGGRFASFAIQGFDKLEGDLPARIQSYVLEWAQQHQAELLENWVRLQRGGTIEKIEPLI